MYVMFQLRPFTVHNVFPCFYGQNKVIMDPPEAEAEAEAKAKAEAEAEAVWMRDPLDRP